MADAEQITDEATFRARVEATLATGGRLSAADGTALLGTDDLSWLGAQAHRVRGAKAGDRTAFRAGSPADGAGVSVVRYGRGDAPADRVAALTAVREAADTAPVHLVVLVREAAEPDDAVSPAESMTLYAVARLLLDNVPDLGCDLGSQEPSTSQLLQHFGASTLLVPAEGFDPTAVAESVWDAGFTPVHVDADGATVRDFGPAASQAERRADPQSVFS